mgnify:FL=1
MKIQREESLKIQSIDHKSRYLQDVIKLWGQNRTTLGLFPKDAFKERATNQEILKAIDSEAEFAGYLLFRTSYNRVTIAHLCIAPSHRGKGITKKLINKLKKITTIFVSKKHFKIGNKLSSFS